MNPRHRARWWEPGPPSLLSIAPHFPLIPLSPAAALGPRRWQPGRCAAASGSALRALAGRAALTLPFQPSQPGLRDPGRSPSVPPAPPQSLRWGGGGSYGAGPRANPACSPRQVLYLLGAMLLSMALQLDRHGLWNLLGPSLFAVGIMAIAWVRPLRWSWGGTWELQGLLSPSP